SGTAFGVSASGASPSISTAPADACPGLPRAAPSVRRISLRGPTTAGKGGASGAEGLDGLDGLDPLEEAEGPGAASSGQSGSLDGWAPRFRTPLPGWAWDRETRAAAFRRGPFRTGPEAAARPPEW